MDTLEGITGQTKVIEEIKLNVCSKTPIVIYGENGVGKKYVLNKISTDGSVEKALSLKHNQGNFGRKFAPFYGILRDRFDEFSNIKSALLQTTAGKIPVIGPWLETILHTGRTQPIEFSTDEHRILSALEKVVGSTFIVFLCEDFHLWDKDSQELLLKMISIPKYRFLEHCNFILTIDNIDILERTLSSCLCFHLKQLDITQIEKILKILLPSHQFNNEQLHFLHQISSGSIGFLIKISKIISQHGFSSLSGERNVYDWICQTIKKLSSPIKLDASQIIELLNKTAVIGYDAHKALLQNFSDFKDNDFFNYVKNCCDWNFLSESPNMISFQTRSFYDAIFLVADKNTEYHYKLAKSIRFLFPSDYEYAALEYYAANMRDEAVVLYIISLIKYYRENRKPLVRLGKLDNLVSIHNYSDYVNQLYSGYQLYYQGKYQECIELFENPYKTTNLRLLFEIEYLRSLAFCNSTVNSSYYQNETATLEKWINNSKFEADMPEQWLRAAILCIEYYFELGDDKHSALKQLIDVKLDLFGQTDKQMMDLRYLFLAKSSIYAPIDLYRLNILQAYKYFSQNMKENFNYSGWLLSSTNYTAQLTVAGDYQQAIGVAEQVLNLMVNLVDGGNNVDLTALINNYFVSCILSGKESENDYYRAFLTLLNNSKDEITQALLKINIICLLTLQKKWEQALEYALDLVARLDISSTDGYYLYFAKNNLAALYLIRGEFENAEILFQEIAKIVPLKNEELYFKYRNESIAAMINNRIVIDIDKQDWNILTVGSKTIGVASKFWNRLSLFTDMENWTD